MTTEPKTILALCAHPDDAEFRCGGTLLLLANRGWRVHIATAGVGDCGTAEESPNAISQRRRKEAQDAAAKLGGTFHCLEGNDLRIFDNDELRAAAVALMRAVDPDCVVTHYPVDYMPDHDAASAIARAVVFTAAMPNYTVGPAVSLPPT
ncbi:MAG: PIG-L deacetylase family protein, partial [Armatimonadota bacterium]